MADTSNGYAKSGGWRFGNKKTSSDFLSNYSPEAYNGGLLDAVGNAGKKGAIDAAVDAKPIDNVIATGLLAPGGGSGLNTRLSDASWADVKAMRDQVGPDGKMAGFNNAYDRPSLKAALAGMGAVFGGPMAMGKLVPQAMAYSQQGMDALSQYGGGTVSPMFGGDFGGGAWQSQINDNAAARQMRQQQSNAEAQAIAAYQAELAAQSTGGGYGGNTHNGNNYGNDSSSMGPPSSAFSGTPSWAGGGGGYGHSGM